jgi:RNA polymerase sigma-70 factor (ECF subfamily)
MAEDDSFDAVMARLRAGESDAANVILSRFTRRLLALARAQLGSTTAAKGELEDVLQSVYKSFFARYKQDQFELADWNELWSLLTIITVRKCVNRRSYHRAGRRDVRRQVPWQGSPGQKNAGWDLVDREPTPLEAAVLADTVQQLFRGMDEPDREAVSMLLQGYTAGEVAVAQRCSERTVRRVRKRVKDRLKKLYAAESGASSA